MSFRSCSSLVSLSSAITAVGAIAGASCFAVGCGDSSEDAPPGSVRVIVEPEDTILEGLSAGEKVANIRDGWTVTYDKYIVAMGHVTIAYATDDALIAEDERAFVVDLSKVPANGEPLWRLDGLRPGRWNFGYALVTGEDDVKRHDSVSKRDFERVVDDDLTYLITGTLTKADGKSCPPSRYAQVTDVEPVGDNGTDPCYANPTIQFEFAVRAESHFDNCELNGVSGLAVTSGKTTTAAATLHGDHLFFNGFPSGDEGGILRLAQIWADADLNLDGRLETAEFESLLIADMPEWDERYQPPGGAPGDEPIETMGQVARAQLQTQGHMNGEGECEVAGQRHEH